MARWPKLRNTPLFNGETLAVSGVLPPVVGVPDGTPPPVGPGLASLGGLRLIAHQTTSATKVQPPLLGQNNRHKRPRRAQRGARPKAASVSCEAGNSAGAGVPPRQRHFGF